MKDPVCVTAINPKYATEVSRFKGRTYYFCCLNCKRAFDNEPMKYVRFKFFFSK